MKLNRPRDSEITIGEWLDQIGLDSAKRFVGRDGEGPPDYEIRYRGNTIAVEATLMHDPGGWGKTKEIAFGRALKRLIQDVSPEDGDAWRWHSICEYDPRVPKPPNKSDDAWKKRVRDAVRSSPAGGEFQLLPENDVPGRGVVLTLMPSSNQGGFAGVSVDEGCIVAGTLSERLASIVRDKADKVRKGKRSGKYAQWWLVVDDKVLMAPFETLTPQERTEVRTRVRTCDGITAWSKVILVSRFHAGRDRGQGKWFYASWEDPRYPSLAESSSSPAAF